MEWRVSASSVQIVSCERVITDPSHPVPPVPSLERQIGNPVGHQALDLPGLAWTGFLCAGSSIWLVLQAVTRDQHEMTNE